MPTGWPPRSRAFPESRTERSPTRKTFWRPQQRRWRPDPASLLMRNPIDPEAIWSLWDAAKPGERQMIVDLARTVTKTGTSN